MRIAVKRNGLTFYTVTGSQSLLMPFAGAAAGGFPSPAQNEMEVDIDLVAEFGMNKDSIRVVRVEGDYLLNKHAPDGSLLVCDTEIDAISQDLIVCSLNGEDLMIRTIVLTAEGWALYTHNSHLNPYMKRKGDKLEVWGVVTQIIFSPRERARSIPGRISEVEIDLTEYLEMNKPSIFVMRVDGNSMIDEHILHNSYLLVDKALKNQQNDFVIAWINEGFTVKTFVETPAGIMLYPANAMYGPIKSRKEDIWGVVSKVIINRAEIRKQYGGD